MLRRDLAEVVFGVVLALTRVEVIVAVEDVVRKADVVRTHVRRPVLTLLCRGRSRILSVASRREVLFVG